MVPGNRDDPRLLCQQPGERYLRRGNPLGGGDVFDEINECLIGLESLGRKARHSTAEIFVAEGGVSADLAGQKTFAERRERHKADAQFFQHGKYLGLRLAPPHRVFALQRRDRLNGMGAPDGLSACLGQSEMPDLALGDQFFDCARNIFNRDIRIDAVLVEADR